MQRRGRRCGCCECCTASHMPPTLIASPHHHHHHLAVPARTVLNEMRTLNMRLSRAHTIVAMTAAQRGFLEVRRYPSLARLSPPPLLLRATLTAAVTLVDGDGNAAAGNAERRALPVVRCVERGGCAAAGCAASVSAPAATGRGVGHGRTVQVVRSVYDDAVERGSARTEAFLVKAASALAGRAALLARCARCGS